MTRSRSAAPAAATIATLGLAAASWILAVRQMTGMDMGVATGLGSFGSFITLWVPMMTAMMLPSAVPAIVRHARATRQARALALFVGAYLAVWALVGIVVYVVYRPHGALSAGVVVIGAGLYELTPLKVRFRRRCRESVSSGFGFGVACLGSSAGLMLMLVALGVMSIPWMSVIAIVVLGQKLLPVNAAIDMPVAIAIVGLGFLIVFAPSSLPGLMPSM